MKRSLWISPGLAVLMVFSACGKKEASTDPYGLNKSEPAEIAMREGIIYLNNNKLDLAEQKLVEAVTLAPSMQHAWNALSLVYIYKRDFPKAIESLNKLLALNPYYYDAVNNLGIVHMEMGELSKAKEYFLTAANAKDNLNPESSYTNLVIIELRQDRLESALRYIDKGLSLNNRCEPLHNLRGVAMERSGRYVEALESFNKVYDLIKDRNADSISLFELAKVFKKYGDREKALNLLEKAIGLTSDSALKEEIMNLIKELGG